MVFRNENLYGMDYEDTGSFGSDAVSQNEALANIINPPAPPAKPAGPSQAAIDALTQQILGQGLTGKWQGKGKGSAEANARDMAKILADTGITDIKQFGKITKTGVPTEVFPIYESQLVGFGDSQNTVNAVVGYEDAQGNRIDPSKVTVNSSESESGSTTTYTAPVGTQEVYGNKATGQEVANTYGGRQGGNAWGGTFEGSGNTGYRVQFGPDGTPYFYTTQASSNDLANLMEDLGPMAQIGLALATGGLSIPQQIAANMAVQILSGQDVGDAIKNAAINMAVANIPGTDLMKDANKFIKDMGLDATTTGVLTNSFNNAAISGSKALLTGKDVGDAMLAGAATGGVNGAVNAMLNSSDMQELTKDLSATQKKLVANAVTGLISGKPLDQVLINSAIAAASAEAKEQAKYKPLGDKALSELSPDERQKYDELGTKGLLQYQSDVSNLERLTNSGRTGDDTGGSYTPDADVVTTLENSGLTQQSQNEEPARINEEERIAELERQREIEVENERQAEIARASEEARQAEDNRLAELRIAAQRETTDPADFLDLNNPAGKSADPDVVDKGNTSTPTLPDAGTVEVKGKTDTCPVGTYYDPITNSCEKAVDTTATTPSTPDTGVTPATKGEVVVTAPRCEAGFVYDELLKACVPIERIDSKLITGEADPTKVTDQGTVKVVGKKETCPTGTVLNEITGECDPAWDEGHGETCPTGQMLDPNTGLCVPVKDQGSVTVIGNRETCPTGTVLNAVTGDCDPITSTTTTTNPATNSTTCPTGQTWDAAQSKCVPVASTGGGGGGGSSPTTKPATPSAPSFTPSLTAGSTSQETIDPFYAGDMGDFSLFSTLEDILAGQSDKKDSTKSKDKTKMASGGHLDDLLAQQLTVDDLLNLLR